MRRLPIVCFLTCFCYSQQPEDLTIKVNVNLIQVDVTVLDRAGKHVEGLSADDFEVYRDGKKQSIKNVLYVSRPALIPAPPPVPGSIAAPSLLAASLPTKELQPKDVRRTIAVYIDDLSINFLNLVPVREALRKFVLEQIQPGDLVAVYFSSGGLGLFQQYTTDKRAILASIERMRYRSLNGVDSLAPISMNPAEEDPNPTIAQQALEMRLREEVNMQERQDMLTAGMLNHAGSIVRGLRELPGRKSMVVFSESMQLYDNPTALNNPNATTLSPGGMGSVRTRTIASMNSLIDTANRSGVTFYTVDPRGLQVFGLTAADQVTGSMQAVRGRLQQRQADFVASQAGMEVLAEETGGLSFRNTNDLGRAMSEAANDQDGYYLIAFNPDEATFEKGKRGEAITHKLSIKVRRPGLKVRFRKSLSGVTDAEAMPTPSNPIMAAMQSPFRSLDIPMKLTPLYMEDEKQGPFIRALLFVDPSRFQFVDEKADPSDKDQSPWQKAVAEQVLVLFNQQGVAVDRVAQTQMIRLRKSKMENALKNGLIQIADIPVKQPGPYQVRAVMMDTATKKTGSSAQFTFVPDVKNKQLALSDISVTTEAFLQAKSAEGSPGARVFHAGDKIAYSGYIYNAKVAKDGLPNLETQVILYREGKVVFTGKRSPYRPTKFVEGKHLSISGNLQLGSNLAPGEYAVQVAVHDLEAPKKYQFSVRAMDFEIR